MLKRLAKLESPIHESVGDVIGVIATASIELSQCKDSLSLSTHTPLDVELIGFPLVFTHVANFYLAPQPPVRLEKGYAAKKKEYEARLEIQGKIVALAAQPTPDAPALLEGYVREALRKLIHASFVVFGLTCHLTNKTPGLDPATEGVYRQARTAGKIGDVTYKKGDKLWFDFRTEGLNPRTFPDPEKVDPTRRASKYPALQGDGVFRVLGEEFVYGVAASVLQAVFSLPSIRRSNGAAGTLRR